MVLLQECLAYEKMLLATLQARQVRGAGGAAMADTHTSFQEFRWGGGRAAMHSLGAHGKSGIHSGLVLALGSPACPERNRCCWLTSQGPFLPSCEGGLRTEMLPGVSPAPHTGLSLGSTRKFSPSDFPDAVTLVLERAYLGTLCDSLDSTWVVRHPRPAPFTGWSLGSCCHWTSSLAAVALPRATGSLWRSAAGWHWTLEQLRNSKACIKPRNQPFPWS